jgi:hypothetical protein
MCFSVPQLFVKTTMTQQSILLLVVPVLNSAAGRVIEPSLSQLGYQDGRQLFVRQLSVVLIASVK